MKDIREIDLIRQGEGKVSFRPVTQHVRDTFARMNTDEAYPIPTSDQ